MRTEYGKISIIYQDSKIWNKLANEIKIVKHLLLLQCK